MSAAGAPLGGRGAIAAGSSRERRGLALAWALVLGLAVGVRLWNALAGPRMWGYDAWGHVAYTLFLDAYRGLPWADQGWSYFHPPLHYLLGWGLAGTSAFAALRTPAVAQKGAHALLHELPAGLRQVIELRVLQDRSTQDVCRRLAISEPNLFVRLHRARRALAS